MKGFSNGSIMMKAWGITGLLKMVYVKEGMGSRSVGLQLKRWIDSVNKYMKKEGLGVGQMRRMVLCRGL